MILFGLINVLESFQGYFNKILAEKLDILVIVYLDNILSISKIQKRDMSNPFNGFWKSFRNMAFVQI